jgi:Cdc6-like AAA superfamily ATPase
MVRRLWSEGSGVFVGVLRAVQSEAVSALDYTESEEAIMRLIFIEGVPGVGKSTSAEKLCDMLTSKGYTANCFLEADINNPIDLYWYAYLSKPEYAEILGIYPEYANKLTEEAIQEEDYVLLRYQDFNFATNEPVGFYSPELYELLKEREVCYRAKNPVCLPIFTKVFVNRWKSFLKSYHAKRDFVIFDASLLAHQINDMLRNYQLSDEKILQHIKTVWTEIKPYPFVVFYLESTDIWERIRSANISRGQSVPPQGQTAFWENRKRLDMLALNALPIEYHRFDISYGNWDEAVCGMLMLAIETLEHLRRT